MVFKFVILICLLASIATVQAQRRRQEKPGSCPIPLAPREISSNGDHNSGCANDCSRDSDCRGDKKCCSTHCGGKACTDPAPAAKPGQCPANVVQPVCRRECERDNDCRNDNKCCRTNCDGTKCSDPTTLPEITSTTRRPGSGNEKPGVCTPGLSQFNCNTECNRDNDCRGDKKCCPTVCGGSMCSSPMTLTTTTSRPSNSCPRPAEHPGEYICRSNCSNDRDCRNNQKCCTNRCGAKVCTNTGN